MTSNKHRKYDEYESLCHLLLLVFITVIFQVIESIANAIAHTDGCSLLDVDPGMSTNRTVYTFVGSPEAVIEGAMSAARAAYQLIDMRAHQGWSSSYLMNLVCFLL